MYGIAAIIGVATLFVLIVLSINPGAQAFSAVPTGARAEFLRKGFGLTEKACRRMHFDGWNFHHRRKVPYTDYYAIEVGGSELTTVFDEDLPHIVHWRHERLDGGPDLRYRNNKKTMQSELHFITFLGAKTFVLHLYCYPGRKDFENHVENFDRFLCGAREKDYEEEYSYFEEAFEKKERLQRRLDECADEIEICNKVIFAGHRIDDGVLCEEMSGKIEMAERRLAGLERERKELRGELREQERKELAAIEKARSRSETAVNYRTVVQLSRHLHE